MRALICLVGLTLAVSLLLVGCGAVASASGVMSYGVAVVALLAVLLVGCGGGANGSVIDAGEATSTSGTPIATPTPFVTPSANASPTPAPSGSPTPTPTSSPTPTPAIPVSLQFLVQPTKIAAPSAEAFTPIAPAPQVAILDADGHLCATATNLVTISLAAAPPGAQLIGTLSVNAVNGIATFSDLRINRAGSCVLAATAAGLSGADSAGFVVGPVPLHYRASRSFDAGVAPRALTTGDFNEDGKVDFAVCDYTGNQLILLLGVGDGSFTPGPTMATGDSPKAIAHGDFNEDGIDDVVIGSGLLGDSRITVYLGNGDATFREVASADVTRGISDVAVARIAGHDGVMATSDRSNVVQVVVGNGDGTFASPVDYATTSRPASVTAADLNGDGIADMVVGETSRVETRLGSADGTFSGVVNSFSTVVASNIHVAGADFNGDGKIDVLAAHITSDRVSVLLGNGDGTFSGAVNVNVGFPSVADGPDTLAVGDFNGDSVPDFAVTLRYAQAVQVLLGNGDGTFQAPQTAIVGRSPEGLAAADVNGDNKLDLGVANFGSAQVSVLLGRGDGSLVGAPQYPVSRGPLLPVEADFNGDGKPDFALDNTINLTTVLLNNGDGTFHTAPALASESPRGLAAGDFNGDGRPDLAVSSESSNVAVSVFLGNGDGTFRAAINLLTGTVANHFVAAGDFNADGKLDLAVASYSGVVTVLLGNGDGNFQAATNLVPGTTSLGDIHVADFNGDGRPDLAVVNQTPGLVSVMLGNGDGTFQAAQNSAPISDSLFVMTVADLNNDGKPDVALPMNRTGGTAVLLGNGDGTFQAARNIRSAPSDLFTGTLASGDMNADGIPDLVIARQGTNVVGVFLGNGDGTFLPPDFFGTGKAPLGVAVGDLNGDGRLDVVVVNYSGAVSILLNE